MNKTTANKLRTFGALLLALTIASAVQAQVCTIKTSPAVMDRQFDKLFTQNGPGWTGGDSTYSIMLPNRDSAFFFSDSYIAEDPAFTGDGTVTVDSNGIRRHEINCPAPLCNPPTSLFRAKNSIVIRDRTTGKLRTLAGPRDTGGWSTSFFKPAAGTDPSHYFWMGDSIVAPGAKQASQKLWIFLLEFDGKLAYHGSSIAQVSLPTLQLESITKLSGTEGSTVAWGGSLVLGESLTAPTLYIYGIQNKQSLNGKVPYVAKVDPRLGLAKVADARNWLVWNGSTWVKGLANGAQLIGASGDANNAGDQVSDEVAVKKLRVRGRDVYVLVGMDTTIPFGKWKHITLYSACRPEGPWSKKQVVYTTPEAESRHVPGMYESQSLAGPMVVYNPHLHPQFTNDLGLLISYNNNTSKDHDLVFADTYRPHFIRVKIAGLQK
jgi:hypothetical protein